MLHKYLINDLMDGWMKSAPFWQEHLEDFHFSFQILPILEDIFLSSNSTQKQIQPLQIYSVLAFWIFYMIFIKCLEV